MTGELTVGSSISYFLELREENNPVTGEALFCTQGGQTKLECLVRDLNTPLALRMIWTAVDKRDWGSYILQDIINISCKLPPIIRVKAPWPTTPSQKSTQSLSNLSASLILQRKEPDHT
jgi:hypothetical protein